MAKAKIVEKAKKPKQLVKLTLTVGEAETLLNITTRIGGSPDDSPRKHTETIQAALLTAGLSVASHRVSVMNRSIYFYDFDGFNHTDWGF